METLVCISHLRWGFVWQRPQHLLSRLSAKYHVVFVEEPVCTTAQEPPHLNVFPGNGAPNVTVIQLVYPVEKERWIGHDDPLTQQTYNALLSDYLTAKGIVKPILWLYTPMALSFAETIDHKLLIFDVMDQLSAFKGAPASLVEKDKQLLERADIVFTGGVSLYRDKLHHNKNTYLFPSGVDQEHYASASDKCNFERPADLSEITPPILGYFGVIDERLDVELLSQVATKRPEWNFVLIGPVLKIEEASLPRAANLHYLGMKSYDELPAYLAYFDIALIPFVQNEATRFLSPTKTLEYVAAHKPVISTPINDVVELYGEVVHVIHNSEEFIEQADAILRHSPAPELTSQRAKEKELLAQYSWNRIANDIQQIVKEALSNSS